MNIVLVIIGIAAGLIIGYLLAKNLVSRAVLTEKNNYADLDKEFAALRARTENEISNLEKQLDEKQNEL
nr:hypothetical protein [Paludibacter sp.]